MTGRLRIAMALALAASSALAEEAGGWRDRVTLLLSDRMRGEFVDWFAPPAGVAAPDANRYAFFANRLRAGLSVLLPHAQLTLEMQDTRIANLPDDASLAAPQGNLGTGAVYFANTRQTSQGEPFLKQGTLTLRRSGLTATLGRFDYRDGLETVPTDATLAFVKRTRIAERLVGPFDFTHVSRSFDGGVLAYDQPLWNATAWGARPTEGAFDVSANREIRNVEVAGAALTLKRLLGTLPTDARLFYLYYRDARDDVLKVDNRPLAVREADHDPISISTVGAHGLVALDAGPGVVDLLGWTVVQVGSWGTQNHGAWAYAFEAGYQLPRAPLAPWLRVGYDRSSGDDDPDDRSHRTFFQVLPTPRIYAQLPFYNLMNDADFFTELILRPHERVFIRADWHWLEVTEGRDLWYQGGGAGKNGLFGYSGSAAGGRHQLAQLLDLTVNVTLMKQLTLGTYFGHAFGGGVVGESFVGRDASYGFVETTYRY